MRGGGGGEGELGTISSELVLWVSTAAETERGGGGWAERGTLGLSVSGNLLFETDES